MEKVSVPKIAMQDRVDHLRKITVQLENIGYVAEELRDADRQITTYTIDMVCLALRSLGCDISAIASEFRLLLDGEEL